MRWTKAFRRANGKDIRVVRNGLGWGNGLGLDVRVREDAQQTGEVQPRADGQDAAGHEACERDSAGAREALLREAVGVRAMGDT